MLTVRVMYYRYVVRACEAAKTDDPTHEQRVVYVSVRFFLAYGWLSSRVDPLSLSPP